MKGTATHKLSGRSCFARVHPPWRSHIPAEDIQTCLSILVG